MCWRRRSIWLKEPLYWVWETLGKSSWLEKQLVPMCSALGFSNLKVGCPHVRFTNCLHCIAVGLPRTENPVTPWLPGPQSRGPRKGDRWNLESSKCSNANPFGKNFHCISYLLVVVQSLGLVQLYLTPWTVACRASLSFHYLLGFVFHIHYA